MAVRSSAQSRNLARKQRDKWKAKRIFSIRAPRNPWHYKKIGETIGENEQFIEGRIFQTTQQEFDGDFTKYSLFNPSCLPIPPSTNFAPS